MAQGPDRIAMTAFRPTATRLADLIVPAALGVAAFVIVILFFAPRFILWSWLDLDPDVHHPAEFTRAIEALKQLDNPFVKITSSTNRVITWRLLFPILGHYLHLPRLAYLSLPALGCLPVLGYVAYLVRRESGPWWAALAASALTGTTSWFFVSTGWLAYFDSWCVLGMLVAAFGRSKIATGIACLLTPWVDERFVLTLPLVVVIRSISSSWFDGRYSARFLSEGLIYFWLVAPYCLIRVVALAAAVDEGSAVHLRSHLATARDFRQIADGMWSGLRGLWLFVALVPVLLFRKGRAPLAGLFLLVVTLTLAANVSVAHDLSRSASAMIPAAVLGIVLLVRARPALAAWPLAAVLAFNLLTPARHVIEYWGDTVQIYSLHFELYRLKHPPRSVALLHIIRAQKLAEQGDLPRALAEVDESIRVDPKLPEAHGRRALFLNNLGRFNDAAASFDAAVRLAPQSPAVYRDRAAFHRVHDELEAAAQDLQSAVDLSPAGSRDREALERDLATVRQALGKP